MSEQTPLYAAHESGHTMMGTVVAAHAAYVGVTTVRRHGVARTLLLLVLSVITLGIAGLFFWNTIATPQWYLSILGTGVIFWLGMRISGAIVGATYPK